MKFIRTTVSVAVAATIGAVFATAALAQAGIRFDQRDARQQHRIEHGVNAGQITPREADRLGRGEARIDHMQARAMRDGVITSREQARIGQAQDRQGREIYRAAHNDRTTESNRHDAHHRNPQAMQHAPHGRDNAHQRNPHAAPQAPHGRDNAHHQNPHAAPNTPQGWGNGHHRSPQVRNSVPQGYGNSHSALPVVPARIASPVAPANVDNNRVRGGARALQTAEVRTGALDSSRSRTGQARN